MIVQFATLEGENKGPQIDVPLGSTVLQMEELMNQLLENKDKVRKCDEIAVWSGSDHTAVCRLAAPFPSSFLFFFLFPPFLSQSPTIAHSQATPNKREVVKCLLLLTANGPLLIRTRNAKQSR